MRDLLHYAHRAVTCDSTCTYEQTDRLSSFAKPKGFWVSAKGEDDWAEYCLGEHNGMSPDSRLRFAYGIALSPSARIVTLHTPQDLHDMAQRYAAPSEFDLRHNYGRKHWGIDWRAVAANYDGILIPTYHWSCRMTVDWYYTWDCASGCIWNLDAIESVTPTYMPALTAAAAS